MKGKVKYKMKEIKVENEDGLIQGPMDTDGCVDRMVVAQGCQLVEVEFMDSGLVDINMLDMDQMMEVMVPAQMKETMEENIPLKTVRLRDTDKRFFTTELKEIDCQRKREYVKNRKSANFFALKEKL